MSAGVGIGIGRQASCGKVCTAFVPCPSKGRESPLFCCTFAYVDSKWLNLTVRPLCRDDVLAEGDWRLDEQAGTAERKQECE